MIIKIHGSMHDGLRSEVQFLVNDEYHTLSITEFVATMGLYDEDFLSMPAFRDLPFSWPISMTSYTYWTKLRRGTYNASTTKGSNFKDPMDRVLHYVLAHSTTSRTNFEDVVNARNMLQLWSMYSSTRINVGVFASFCLQRQFEKGYRGVYLGALITKIIKNLGLFPI